MNGALELFGLAGKISATGLVVIVILVLLSVWSLGVSLERLFVLARARRQSIAFVEKVSQGIAEALLTTALGLVVAVPAAWMFNVLSQRIQRLGLEMESSSSELIDYFLEREGMADG